STSAARSMACSLVTSRCSWTASAICLPTVIVGFSEVSGSWKIMPISLPRTCRRSSSLSLLMSLSLSRMLPPTIEPPVGSRFMIDSAVMVLPQPDSPTMPSVSPGSTYSEMSSTACTVERFSLISVRRLSICNSGATRSPTLPALKPGLEGVAERVADEVERDARDDDREARRINQPPVVRAGLNVLQPPGQHVAPVGRGRLHAQAEEAQAGQDDDRVGHRERALHDDRADRVGHDVAHDRPGAAAADDLDRLHVLPGAQAQRLTADQPGHAEPVEHRDDEDHDERARAEDHRQDDDDHDVRDREAGVDDAHQERVDRTADEPGEGSVQGADEDRHDSGGDPDLQGGLAADHQPADLVIAEVVAAEQVLSARRAQGLAQVRVYLIGVVDVRAHEAEQHHEDDHAEADQRELVLGEDLPAPPQQAVRLTGGGGRVDRPWRCFWQERGAGLASIAGPRNDSHQLYLTLGSSTAYPMSASRFPTIVASVAMSVNPSRTW